jgi:hypothetical protein
VNLVVKRRQSTPQSVCGELWDGAEMICFTLEPPYRGDGLKPRAIPAGTYDLTIRRSEHFHRMMPHVENVPGFSEIMLHWGNYPQDTEGCTIVGSIVAANFVGHSRAEFDTIFLRIQDALAEGPQVISYLDPIGAQQ